MRMEEARYQSCQCQMAISFSDHTAHAVVLQSVSGPSASRLMHRRPRGYAREMEFNVIGARENQ